MDTSLAGSLLQRSGEEAVKARLREETEAALGRCETGREGRVGAVPTPCLQQFSADSANTGNSSSRVFLF